MRKYVKYLPLVAVWLLLTAVAGYGAVNFSVSAADSDNLDSRLSGAVALYVGSSSAIAGGEETAADETDMSAVPFIKEGTAFIPLRFVSEKMGAEISWNVGAKTATVKAGANEAVFKAGDSFMTLNGVRMEMSAAPVVLNGRAYVPVRALSEKVLGKEVFWHDNLIIISDTKDIFDAERDAETLSEITARINQLSVVGTKERLAKLMRDMAEEMEYKYSTDDYYITEEAVESGAAPESDMSSANMSAPAEPHAGDDGNEAGRDSGGEYYATNIQVAGVDEGDIVKTDGKYIYQAGADKIVIIQAYPANEMKIMSEIKYGGESTEQGFDLKNQYNERIAYDSTYPGNTAPQPVEVYVDGDRLVVVLNEWEDKVYSKAMVYDIADRANVKLIREVALEGNYLASRKVGDCVYLISNEHLDYYPFVEGSPADFDDAIPVYKDSAAADEYVKVDLGVMRRFPGNGDMSHMFIAGFNINNVESPADITSYLGSGNQVYCGRENLYIARPVYNYDYRYGQIGETTEIYRFAISGGVVSFEKKGEVSGQPLNQFSMDEYDGYFRIATTGYGRVENDMVNSLHVLSANTLEPAGKIENMAKGERIYSVRFMGAKAYIVTFRTVDPLFVIDISDPRSPAVLGELKIPGFSQYLHPYDENHIIGFGMDTEAVRENLNWYISERVVETGMKMALFDVTDAASPKEMFSVKIGDRGTFSEILYNHRALLFSKEKDIIAFPVTVYKQSDREFDYGRAEFQGAIVYGLSLEDGFALKGKISHTDERYVNYWDFDYTKQVERILYIDDVLYTSSRGLVKASDMNTLREIKSVGIETPEYTPYGPYVIE